MNDTLEKLNQHWRVIKSELEAEFNKDCKSFGDLQPGNLYHIVLVTSYQEQKDINKQPWAGGIKDFLLYSKEVEKPELVIKRAYGYSGASRIANNDLDYARQALIPLLEEIKLTVKNNLNIDMTGPGYGYRVKFSDFKEEEEIAAFTLTIESNFIPMIQIGKDSNDRNPRMK